MQIFLQRNGPPWIKDVSPLQKTTYRNERISEGAGNHSRLTSSDTVLPNGCSESESKSGISSYWSVRKGGPEALKQDIAIETKQSANNTPGPSSRVIPCCGLVSLRNPTTHTSETNSPVRR